MARKGQVIDQEAFPICEEADHQLTVEGVCLCGAARTVWGLIEIRDRRGRLLESLSPPMMVAGRNELLV